MVVFRVWRSWLSTITLHTANELMFTFKKNLLEILFLAGSAGHNEMGRTLGLKDYSLSSTGIFDTKTRESKQDVVWNTKLPYFWEGFPGQEKGQPGRCSTGWCTQHGPLAPSGWPKALRTTCQTSRMPDKGLEPSNSSYTTLPAEKGGISPMKSRCMTAPSITPAGLLKNKSSLVSCCVNTITLR